MLLESWESGLYAIFTVDNLSLEWSKNGCHQTSFSFMCLRTWSTTFTQKMCNDMRIFKQCFLLNDAYFFGKKRQLQCCICTVVDIISFSGEGPLLFREEPVFSFQGKTSIFFSG